MSFVIVWHLTLSWRRPISYRNQSIDLLYKSMDWFLYDIDLRHERVEEQFWGNLFFGLNYALNTTFIFFNVNGKSIYRIGKEKSLVGHLVFFVYTGLLVWVFPQSNRISLVFYLKSSMLLAFCFLFFCMADLAQMCPSSISPLGIFQGIMCNIERLKGGTVETWITGGTKTGGGT